MAVSSTPRSRSQALKVPPTQEQRQATQKTQKQHADDAG